MDYSKVQKRRLEDKTRARLFRIATVLFVTAMALTLVPKFEERQIKKEVTATAEEILKMLQSGNWSGAYEICLTADLKKQHRKPAFEGTFRNLSLKKGSMEEWSMSDYKSHPQGKPYDLVTYFVQFNQGIGIFDFAMVKEGKRWMVKAYRIRATGI